MAHGVQSIEYRSGFLRLGMEMETLAVQNGPAPKSRLKSARRLPARGF